MGSQQSIEVLKNEGEGSSNILNKLESGIVQLMEWFGLGKWIMFGLIMYYLMIVIWGLYSVFKFKSIVSKMKCLSRKRLISDDMFLFARQDCETWSMCLSIVGVIFLLPLRIIMVIFLVSLQLLVTYISSFSDYFHKLNPEKKAHMNSTRGNNSFFNSILRRLSGCTLYCCGISVEECSFDDSGTMWNGTNKNELHMLNTVIMNHLAIFDIIYACRSLQPSFIAKQSVAGIPLIGTVAKAMDTVFVERGDASSRETALHKIVERQELLSIQINNNQKSVSKTNNFRPLCIFPEGTTTSGLGLLPFKRGAFMNEKSSITPVILNYSSNSSIGGLFVPTFDIVPPLLYLALTLSNLGFVRLTAHWYIGNLKRWKTESVDEFMNRCEGFMRKNQYRLRKYGRAIGEKVGSDKKTYAKNYEYLKAEDDLKSMIFGKVKGKELYAKRD